MQQRIKDDVRRSGSSFLFVSQRQLSMPANMVEALVHGKSLTSPLGMLIHFFVARANGHNCPGTYKIVASIMSGAVARRHGNHSENYTTVKKPFGDDYVYTCLQRCRTSLITLLFTGGLSAGITRLGVCVLSVHTCLVPGYQCVLSHILSATCDGVRPF